jgi:tetratricopeptide (TPR) repeat protein
MEAYRKAIELAEISRKETPEDAHLLADLGGYYAEVGEPDRALSLLRQAVALAPEDPNVLFLAGDGYELLKRRGDAIRLISRSIALGYHANQLQGTPELAALRADPKFQTALRTEKLSLDTAKKTR